MHNQAAMKKYLGSKSGNYKSRAYLIAKPCGQLAAYGYSVQFLQR
jgi:hypothetical protein